MGIRPPQRAAAGHGGRKSHARGCCRDHGDGPPGAPRRSAVPGRCFVHRGAARGSSGVRSGIAAGRLVTRRNWMIAILAIWALSLGWLVKREVFRPTGARLAEAALAVPPGALFYRLDVGDQQVGYPSTTIDTLGNTLKVDNVFVLDVPAMGALHRTSARSTAILSRALRLESVETTFDGDLGQFVAHGHVVGDSVLSVTIVVQD